MKTRVIDSAGEMNEPATDAAIPRRHADEGQHEAAPTRRRESVGNRSGSGRARPCRKRVVGCGTPLFKRGNVNVD